MWSMKLLIKTLLFRTKKKMKKAAEMVKTGAEQWAEAEAAVAAEDHRPCRDFFH